ncbi:uncharacterized protein RCC_07471 [Ramularia collo-cygni]|uniref:Uncharacterized protein n=1 Tax=Ramularia collo-cygni TaxID=112498 RepID=A0A2D3VA08_9PEZI|nr:uncharacterized protein RCC_07471 [Ramularia collo-cygni]CZT21607.1 uncharacterized protein RCC_07471 [Ramularia collo-cygni]
MSTFLRPRESADASGIETLRYPRKTSTATIQKLEPDPPSSHQQPNFLPEPNPTFDDGPERERQQAEFVRGKYLPWLEWKVKVMTACQRTNFLETYAAGSLLQQQAVLAYWVAYPEHIPTRGICHLQAAREERGLNPELDPSSSLRNLAIFPRACRGESVFCPAEHVLNANVGPRNELSSENEATYAVQKEEPRSEGLLRGIGRCIWTGCARLGRAKSGDGK